MRSARNEKLNDTRTKWAQMPQLNSRFRRRERNDSKVEVKIGNLLEAARSPKIEHFLKLVCGRYRLCNAALSVLDRIIEQRCTSDRHDGMARSRTLPECRGNACRSRA